MSNFNMEGIKTLGKMSWNFYKCTVNLKTPKESCRMALSKTLLLNVNDLQPSILQALADENRKDLP